MKVGRVEKLFCHRCGKHTNHMVIAKRSVRFDPDYEDPWGEDHYFAECAGCESLTYAISSWVDGNWNPSTGEMDRTWKTYPRSSTEHPRMKGDHLLPPKISEVYLEVIGAINADLSILPAVGLRALIEAVCRDQGIPRGTLEKLIDGLATKGVLTAAQAKILHGHRFLGNSAAHEAVPPKQGELEAALEIAESVLQTIYIVPRLAKRMPKGRKP